jgi:aspartate carbamoyltransferase catalytic subunit|eukprot:COSAG06_NODE_6100_length_3109_cov_8.218272_4_plen_99_part_00
MQRLGGRVVEVQVAAGGSSVKKGETLSDTVKCLESYCDTIVLRHPQTSSAGEAAAALEPTTGLLNAGNGGAEHPTQALLDLYTIQKDLGKDLDSGTYE